MVNREELVPQKIWRCKRAIA